jgi:hypothetical protein
VELAIYINTELQKICHYFRKNGLSLHPDKTKFIIFSPNQNTKENPIKLFINNNNATETQDPSHIIELQQVKTSDKIPAIKYLGVHFDPMLNFKYHVSNIASKISCALFSLRQSKHFLSEAALKTLYFSLIHCHLTYATVIWSSCNAPTLKQLITKQKMAIRTITGAKFNAHSEPLFKKLNILPLPQLIILQRTEFMYNYVHHELPAALSASWPTVQERRDTENENLVVPNRTLRNDNTLYEPLILSKIAEKLPFFALPKAWNEVCTSLKQCESKIIFKTKSKYFFLEQLSASVNCNRLFCPSCALPPQHQGL